MEYWAETCPEPTTEQRKKGKKEGKLRGELKEWKRTQKRGADKNHQGSDVEALVAMEPVVMMSMETLEDAKRLPVAKM